MSSTNSTEGRLIAIRNQMRDDGQHFLCRDVPPEPYPNGGGAFPGEPPRMQLPPAVCGMGMPEAVARRLAACWNALEGFATEDIEAGAIERLSSAALLADCGPSRLQQLVDALAKTETYLQERVAGNPGSRGATVILPMIRRAIEGAGVAPTQSTWADC